MVKFCRASVLLASVLLLSSCAPKGPALLHDTEADARWQAFLAISEQAPAYGVLSGSLRFGPVNDTRRVTYTLWSGPAGTGTDTVQDGGRTIRLEVDAGVGVNIAKGLFSQGRMLMVLPKEKKAYAGDASPENLRRLLGLSLPMDMESLNDFLAGRFFSALDSPRPERYETGKDGSISYHYRSEEGRGVIVLNEKAQPVRWISDEMWDMGITFDEKALPRKIDGKGENSEGVFRMVLLVKDRLDGSKASGLTLEVPPDSILYSFDR